MLTLIEQLVPDDLDWHHLCHKLNQAISLSEIVLVAWQMGIWLANGIVQQRIQQQAHLPTTFGTCPVCGTALVSKGFVARQILTLVGKVEWKRRVGRCPHQCKGSQTIPFDQVLHKTCCPDCKNFHGMG